MGELLRDLQLQCVHLQKCGLEVACLVAAHDGITSVCGSQLGQQFLSINAHLEQSFLLFLGDRKKVVQDGEDIASGSMLLEDSFQFLTAPVKAEPDAHNGDDDDTVQQTDTHNSEDGNAAQAHDEFDQTSLPYVQLTDIKGDVEHGELEEHNTGSTNHQKVMLKSKRTQNVSERKRYTRKKTPKKEDIPKKKRGRPKKTKATLVNPTFNNSSQEEESDQPPIDNKRQRSETETQDMDKKQRAKPRPSRSPQHFRRTYSCHLCNGIKDKELSIMKHHFQSKHKITLPYSCPKCGENLNDWRLLEEHHNRHENIERHACRYCDRKFPGHLTLGRHELRTHDKEFCPHCGIKFKSVQEVRHHVDTEHDINFSAQCSECDKHFTSSLDYKQHCDTAHVIQPQATFICDICGFSTTTRSKLTVHRYIHENSPYTCIPCNRRFQKKTRLEDHEAYVHRGERNYVCPTCGLCFEERSCMRKHIRKHNGWVAERKFLCPFCAKTFTTQMMLIRHQFTHTGEKPFRCSVCGKGFGNESNMRRHQRCHTADGQKPYPCHLCDKGYTQPANLKNHLKVSHQVYDVTFRKNRRREYHVDNTVKKQLYLDTMHQLQPEDNDAEKKLSAEDNNLQPEADDSVHSEMEQVVHHLKDNAEAESTNWTLNNTFT